METQLVITGGYNSSQVTMYDMNGFVAQLPDMAEARMGHGCGYYRNDNNQIVSLKKSYYITLKLKQIIPHVGNP